MPPKTNNIRHIYIYIYIRKGVKVLNLTILFLARKCELKHERGKRVRACLTFERDRRGQIRAPILPLLALDVRVSLVPFTKLSADSFFF